MHLPPSPLFTHTGRQQEGFGTWVQAAAAAAAALLTDYQEVISKQCRIERLSFFIEGIAMQKSAIMLRVQLATFVIQVDWSLD
jgi:hypothetical protein